MLRYEIKKVFSRASSRIALLLMFLLLGITCYLAIHNVSYMNENGEKEYGFSAVRKLREARQEWSGTLTEEKIADVIAETARIHNSAEYNSNDLKVQEIAYGWGQGVADIQNLIVKSFCSFRNYDFYILDSLSPQDAVKFYPNRITQLEEWLNTEAKDQYTDTQKAFLMQKYQELETPFQYDYMEGWVQLLEFSPTIFMVLVLILGFLAAGIFSGEFQSKANSVFYSSYYGRNKAVKAKVLAGFSIVSGIYWLVALLYTVIVLGFLGADGANCPIQANYSSWKSIYDFTNMQEYLLLLIGGYIGSLFMLFLTMLVSAKTKSAVIAVTIPFILLFIPSFISGINIPLIRNIVGLLPDQLLQIHIAVGTFSLYQAGGKVVGSIGILLILYIVLTILLLPVLYQVYRKAQIK